MVRAVITGASSAIGTVCADRLTPNRHQNTTDSSSREVLESSV
jgi:NADP-dependent 3-hydroxy acid dehydrogenase YdfG